MASTRTDIVIALNNAWEGLEHQLTELQPTNVLRDGDALLMFFELSGNEHWEDYGPSYGEVGDLRCFHPVFEEMDEIMRIIDHGGPAEADYHRDDSDDYFEVVLRDCVPVSTAGEGEHLLARFNLGGNSALH